MYKKNVGDIWELFVIEILGLLVCKGVFVGFYDFFVNCIEVDGFVYERILLNDVLEDMDVVVIIIDYDDLFMV